MSPFVAGLLALGLPLVLLGLVFLRRNVPVFVFYLVALAVGLGYLTSTGAVEDVGKLALAKAEALTSGHTAAPAAVPAK